jgi:hypothetical protein
MKIVKEMGAQGDVIFRRISKLPTGLKEVKTTGPVIVAHSETGHNHQIKQGEAKLFEKLLNDPMICYLQIDGYADVEHMRDYDTHETQRLEKGVWEVRRQRELGSMGPQMVID